jgi:hypothetical protein
VDNAPEIGVNLALEFVGRHFLECTDESIAGDGYWECLPLFGTVAVARWVVTSTTRHITCAVRQSYRREFWTA